MEVSNDLFQEPLIKPNSSRNEVIYLGNLPIPKTQPSHVWVSGIQSKIYNTSSPGHLDNTTDVFQRPGTTTATEIRGERTVGVGLPYSDVDSANTSVDISRTALPIQAGTAHANAHFKIIGGLSSIVDDIYDYNRTDIHKNHGIAKEMPTGDMRIYDTIDLPLVPMPQIHAQDTDALTAEGSRSSYQAGGSVDKLHLDNIGEDLSDHLESISLSSSIRVSSHDDLQSPATTSAPPSICNTATNLVSGRTHDVVIYDDLMFVFIERSYPLDISVPQVTQDDTIECESSTPIVFHPNAGAYLDWDGLEDVIGRS